MANITPRSTKAGTSYFVRVKVKGKTYAKTFELLRDAKKWAAQKEAELLHKVRFDSPYPDVTVADLFSRYLREKKNELKSYKDYVTALGLFEKDHAWKRICEIRRKDILNFREGLLREKNNTRVNRIMAYISSAFSFAVQEELLEASPMVNMSKLKEPRGRTRFLSDEERERLLEASAKHEILNMVVNIALATGARRGEILNLTWSTVDFVRGLVIIEDSKNGERRTIPLFGKCLDLLRGWWKKSGQPKKGFIFAGSGQGPFDIRKSWAKAIKKAGLSDFRFHDLRHTCASYLAMSGVSIGVIAEILGHKTLQMTKRYSHLDQEHKKSVLEELENKLSGQKKSSF